MGSIVGACAGRVSRLDADGTPDFDNPTGAFCWLGGISKFEHDFEIEEGKSIFTEDACGNACVNLRRRDRTKWATFTLTMCKKFYELEEILDVAAAITVDDEIIGSAVQADTGCDNVAFGNGVAIELWSENIECETPDTDFPYVRAVLERAYLTPAGYTRENDTALPVYKGFAVVNNSFSDGPFGDLDALASIDRVIFAELNDDALPDCGDDVTAGYVALPAGAS